MKQKIFRFTLLSPNNMHALRSKLCMTITLSMNSNGGPGILVFHSCIAVMIEGTRDMSLRFFGRIKQNIIKRLAWKIKNTSLIMRVL